MRSSSFILRALAIAAGLAVVASPAFAMSYRATDLGAPPSPYVPGRVNGSGQVAGTLANGHAFVYTPGIGAVDIGTLGEGVSNHVYALNNAGQVAGHGRVNGVERAFLYTPGVGMVDIGPCDAAGIEMNQVGQVAGTWNGRAFIYTPGSGTAYLSVPNGVCFGWAINDLGQIAGQYRLNSANSSSRPFFWAPGSDMIDLGTLSGEGGSAWAVNNVGQVAGWSSGSVFLYTPGAGMIDIGTSSIRSSIVGMNSAAQIIGNTGSGDAARGVVYSADLGWTILDPLAGFTSSAAIYLSDAGYIMGTSTDASGVRHVVRWDVVPEPSSLLALLAGLGGILSLSKGGVMLRRRRSH